MASSFDKLAGRYDSWFDRHSAEYYAELTAVREMMPQFYHALEVGAGTGRFAAQLGISEGVEPSDKMAQLARKRGVKIVNAYAENLPFAKNTFDLVLFITSICFVKSPLQSLREAQRVLVPGGYLLIGFIDKNSQTGKRYRTGKNKNPFYRNANFFSLLEIENLARKIGFVHIGAKSVYLYKADKAECAKIIAKQPGDFTVFKACLRSIT